MLFLLFGSSASGKTSALDEVRGRVADLALHDFDEIGVPPGADTAWRHRVGEFLSAPSAPRVEAVSACLLDCDDATRVARLRARGPAWFARTAGDLEDYLSWAAWMRRHASDPSWRTDVIRHEATEREMQWARVNGWRGDDPRWRVRVIDTSDLRVEDVGMRLAEWIREQRALLRSGTHPLPGAALANRV